MDENETHTFETPNSINKYYLVLNKLLRLFVPVSLLSLLLSYTKYFLYSSYKFQLSTLVFSLTTHTLERKYMFLICNGILAFLTTSLCFNSPINHHGEFPKGNEEEEAIENVAFEGAKEDVKTEVLIKESEGEKDESLFNEEVNEENEEEIGNEVLIKESEGDKDDGVEEGESFIIEEEGKKVDLNGDELNKKFEEFIRKMKEEIRIEAQQSLVVA